jgi:dihydroorotase
MPLEQVIACGSTNAARVFPAFADRGTLRVGSPADITVLDLQDGSFEFVDNENTVRIGRQKLVASEVVLGGKRVDR